MAKSFKVLEPVNKLPTSRQDSFVEKYNLVFQELKSLKANQYLPIEFQDHGEADNLAVSLRHRGLTAKKRNLIVYVKVKNHDHPQHHRQ